MAGIDARRPDAAKPGHTGGRRIRLFEQLEEHREAALEAPGDDLDLTVPPEQHEVEVQPGQPELRVVRFSPVNLLEEVDHGGDAEVVGLAFQHGAPDIPVDRLAGRELGQLLLDHLVLEVLRRRDDDKLAAGIPTDVLTGRDEVPEGFAGAGAGLDGEDSGVVDGVDAKSRKGKLPLARLERRYVVAQLLEDKLDVFRGNVGRSGLLIRSVTPDF